MIGVYKRCQSPIAGLSVRQSVRQPDRQWHCSGSGTDPLSTVHRQPALPPAARSLTGMESQEVCGGNLWSSCARMACVWCLCWAIIGLAKAKIAPELLYLRNVSHSKSPHKGELFSHLVCSDIWVKVLFSNSECLFIDSKEVV